MMCSGEIAVVFVCWVLLKIVGSLDIMGKQENNVISAKPTITLPVIVRYCFSTSLDSESDKFPGRAEHSPSLVR